MEEAFTKVVADEKIEVIVGLGGRREKEKYLPLFFFSTTHSWTSWSSRSGEGMTSLDFAT